ncbi:MAG: efflux RND transporter permease subunit, partial [Wenzhouxiangellaceae bacterium]
YNQVLARLWPRLTELDLPPSVRIEVGGSAAEAGDANTALFTTLPIGMLLLLAFLLWQFNSFRLVAIVLATVPLAAIGVVPGLILAGQAFSFTALLGVVRRTRPILMTTATTIAGLAPLTLTQSTLWPPMAWAIISGLISSTLLTLLVIPVLYRLLMNLGLSGGDAKTTP